MLVPHIVGGSPVISRIIAHNRRASPRRASSGTRARNPSGDVSVWRITGLFLAAMPSYSHVRAAPGTRAELAERPRPVWAADESDARARSLQPGPVQRRRAVGAGRIDYGTAGCALRDHREG